MSSTFTVEPGFSGQRLFELDVHPFARHVGHAVEQLGVDLVGGFQVGFVIVPRYTWRGFSCSLLCAF